MTIATAGQQTDPRPLVVDLDGTLIRTDLLVESFLALMAKHPFAAIRALGMLRHGKAALKAHLADLVSMDVHLLPLDPAVVTLIEQARADGRPVYLASASDARYVKALADHLGWFDGIFGSEPGNNLSGKAKADVLVKAFGARGFDYVGNDKVDMHVWEHGATPYLAGGSSTLARSLRQRRPDAVVLDHRAGGLKPYIKALRPHQWLKNLLIFAPAAAGHQLFPHLVELMIAFVAFSLCASSVYITNDLLDLQGDRDHPRKRHRPFSSGTIPATRGMIMAIGLLLIAFELAALVPPMFALSLAAYYVLTTAYSLYLKRKPIVDVIVLACLYGMRLVAGGYASGTVLSPWLEGLAVFLFLSLALVKRCAEINGRIRSGKGELKGRGYRLDDLPMLEAMAAASGYNAALVLALYINSAPERFLYAHPHRLWLLCILLLAWISRILLLTRRGHMNEDPVIFAVRDRWSLVLGILCGLVIVAARL